jgi:hypothetical protein
MPEAEQVNQGRTGQRDLSESLEQGGATLRMLAKGPAERADAR